MLFGDVLQVFLQQFFLYIIRNLTKAAVGKYEMFPCIGLGKAGIRLFEYGVEALLIVPQILMPTFDTPIARQNSLQQLQKLHIEL
ncbi:MAG: hypothetical protein ACU837_05800 [Gammaproteobacteria bacterium]